MKSKELLSVFDWPSQKPHRAGTQCQRYTLLICCKILSFIPSLHCFCTPSVHCYMTLFIVGFTWMPGSSVGKALVSHTGVQGSIPTSDMKSFFNKYLQMQLLISLSRNLSCSNVEYSKSASVDCMHPLFSKNQSQLSCIKYKIMLCISQQSG